MEIKSISDELHRIKAEDGITDSFGGVLTISKKDISFDHGEVERIFRTRHSVRQFKKDPVPEILIEKAVSLAQTAPSACNRQAVRVYVMDSMKFLQSYKQNLQGVGGFIDNSDKVILITGKISAYEEDEYKQFIVSAGIFTGYLTLSLHALGVGACVVQRSLRPNEAWKDFCKQNSIPLDEQIIDLIVIGQMKEETLVPVSKRFETKDILKWL